jgi:phosphatidylinositol-3-phosphatase
MRALFWNRMVRWAACIAAVGSFLLLSPAAHPQSSAVRTVFVIVMSNQSWADIKANPNAPYINGLLADAAFASAYSALPFGRPMLADFLFLEAGTDFGVQINLSPTIVHWNTTKHLVDLLEVAGISWKAYQEDISGTDCPLITSGMYTVSSNPFVFFDDIAQNVPRCVQHVRPYSELAMDLSSSNLARYNFIRPNLCDSMLQCGVAQGDKWLSQEVPKILSSDAYKTSGALFILWDHPGASGDGPVGMILLSPFGKHGYVSAIPYTHASTLRTLEEIFGVLPWLGAAPSQPSLEDLFASSGAGNSTAMVGWNGSAGATSYKVMRGSSVSGPFSTIASGVTSTSYVDRGLIAGATYFYRVSAVNDSGESPPSAPMSLTIGTVPPTPTNVSVKQGP